MSVFGESINWPEVVLGAVLGGVFGIWITGASTYLGDRFHRRHLRAVWGQKRRSNNITIIMATSGRIDTTWYHRPVTGLGQARALGLLAPSLIKIYKTTPDRFALLSEYCEDANREGDLILLGGPKNNKVTRDALRRLNAQLPLTMETREGNEVILRCSPSMPEQVVASTNDRARLTPGESFLDYGLIIRVPNPFDPSGTLTVLAGVHTFGVVAAVRYFLANEEMVRGLGARYAIVTIAHVTEKEYVEKPELFMGPVTF